MNGGKTSLGFLTRFPLLIFEGMNWNWLGPCGGKMIDKK
jgi:hypothetical protein